MKKLFNMNAQQERIEAKLSALVHALAATNIAMQNASSEDEILKIATVGKEITLNMYVYIKLGEKTK
jgi:hypothetical protein